MEAHQMPEADSRSTEENNGVKGCQNRRTNVKAVIRTVKHIGVIALHVEISSTMSGSL